MRGSTHDYKYALAYVVAGQCVIRYDNEAGKGDHKHFGDWKSHTRLPPQQSCWRISGSMWINGGLHEHCDTLRRIPRRRNAAGFGSVRR